MNNLVGRSFAASAGAKQKPVHCSGLIARKITDKCADMDNHAVPPPEYQVGGDSNRENLRQQDSERVTRTTTGSSSSGQLEAAGASSSARLVATEDPSNTGERKLHLQTTTDGEKYIKKFDDPAKNFNPQSEEEHESYNQSKMWQRSYQSSRFPAQRFDLDPIYDRLFMGFILAYKVLDFPVQDSDLEPVRERLHMGFILAKQGSRRLQKDGDEKIIPRTQDLIVTVQRQVKTLIDHKDTYNMQILNTFRLSRISLLSDPAATLNQDESPRVLRLYIVLGSVESRSIQQLGNKIV